MSKKKGLYIHIPFCKYICHYCDFCKKHLNVYNKKEYMKLLIKELSLYKKEFHLIDSIYIGGGTPSALNNDELKILLDYLNENININYVKEFTIEINPDDVNEKLIDLLSGSNINRISLGVQSLNNDTLKMVNRNYTKQDVFKAIKLLSSSFDNISVDLMFNLPNQNKNDILESINFLKENKNSIKHVSFYSLILEENTVLYNKNFSNLDEESESEYYKFIQENLLKEGFDQYEISNFAQKGYESYHNKKYWSLEEYIGVGLSASSYLNSYRYTSTRSLKEYENGLLYGNEYIVEKEFINEKEHLKEQIIFGLRTTKGIKNNIKLNSKVKKFLDVEGENIKIKRENFFLSNQIILDILDLNE